MGDGVKHDTLDLWSTVHALESRIEALERTIGWYNDTPNPLAEAMVFDPVGDIRQGVIVPASEEEAQEYLLSKVKREPTAELSAPEPPNAETCRACNEGWTGTATITTEPLSPAPRKPREWWVNVYSLKTGYAYATREMADSYCAGDRLECIPVREILPGEEDELRQLSHNLATEQNNHQQCRRDYDAVCERLNKAEPEVDRLRRLVEALMAEREHERQQERDRGDEYRRDWEAEKSRRQEAEKEVDRLTRQLEFERDCISEARKELKRLDGVSEAEQSRRMELEREMKRVKLDACDSQASLRTMLGRAQDEVERLKSDLAGMTAARNLAEHHTEQLRQELERADDGTITRLRVADAEMDEQVKRLRADLAKLTAERDVLRGFVEKLDGWVMGVNECIKQADAAREG